MLTGYMHAHTHCNTTYSTEDWDQWGMGGQWCIQGGMLSGHPREGHLVIWDCEWTWGKISSKLNKPGTTRQVPHGLTNAAPKAYFIYRIEWITKAGVQKCCSKDIKLQLIGGIVPEIYYLAWWLQFIGTHHILKKWWELGVLTAQWCVLNLHVLQRAFTLKYIVHDKYLHLFL